VARLARWGLVVPLLPAPSGPGAGRRRHFRHRPPALPTQWHAL